MFSTFYAPRKKTLDTYKQKNCTKTFFEITYVEASSDFRKNNTTYVFFRNLNLQYFRYVLFSNLHLQHYFC